MTIYTTFDAPIYKVLANNDTGAAPGHQGGFVLPKDLEDYLPLLRNQTSVLVPTVDVAITAELFDGTEYLGTVETRYQYQTWGGARSPERRITRNLSKLLNRARGGDILIIERGIEVENHYRFRLIKEQDTLHATLINSFGGARWGVLNPNSQPTKETAVVEAEAEIEAASLGAFALFDDDAGLDETPARRVARSRAFKRIVFEAYNRACAFCGGGFLHPKGRVEADASHIISRSLKGSDDIRNGLLLCKRHHWAFDNGLVGIGEDFKLIIPNAVGQIERNADLVSLQNQPLKRPERAEYHPAAEAVAWHRQNVLIN